MHDSNETQLSPDQEAVVKRALELQSVEPTEPLQESARAAMRAFLQRAETRLSTYQRVAGVFLNGAGLLVLLPAMARDSIQSVLTNAVSIPLSPFNLLLLVPWTLTLGLPLYAFVLLLRDLVEFYFAPRFLSNDNVQITRFSLAGLSFAFDESIEAKARILAYATSHPAYNRFVLGDAGSASRRSARQIYDSSKSGNIAFPMRRELARELEKRAGQAGPAPDEPIEAEFSMIAASIAGSLDISLTEEVARVEASIERHVLGLRRLVLRYMKALLLFVWTTLATLIVVAIFTSGASPRTHLIAAFIAYELWALSAIVVVRWPRRWIDHLARGEFRDSGTKGRKIAQDEDIRRFERIVTIVLVLAIVAFAAALLGVIFIMNG